MKRTKLTLLLAGGVMTMGLTASAQPAQPSLQPAQPPQQEQNQVSETELAEMQSQLEELHGELETISVRLNDIHQEALLSEDVRQLLIDYETAFNDKAKERAPGLEEQVEKHAQLLGKIEDINGNADELDTAKKAELDQLLERHALVKRQLAPIEGQLMSDPEMQEARGRYQHELIAAMAEVEPEVNDIIDERMELAQNFMALQQEFIQLQQQRQTPPQAQPGHQPGQGQGHPQGGQAPAANR